jgi:uncharacterized protein YjgD (DUF1641 family)
MVAPYDYSGALSPVDPAQAIMSGLATGQKFAQVQQQEQQRRQLAETEAQFEREFEAAVDSRDPLAVAGLLGRFPGKAEILQKVSDQFTKEERDQKLVQGMKLLGLSISGKPESIKNHYTELADLYEQSGDTESADLARKNLAVFEEDPDLWRGNQSLVMAAGMGADNFASTFKTLQETVREGVQAKVEAAKAQSLPRQKLRDAGIIGEPRNTTDSDKFANGLTMYRTELGEIYGVDVFNNILQGEKLAEAVQQAQDFEIAAEQAKYSAREQGRYGGQEGIRARVEGDVAGAKSAAENAQTQGKNAYETLVKVRLSIGNIDAAIGALDDGANTGAIASKFPNWNAATIELANIRNLQGLDIVNSVTFGALSVSELDLALATALPMNMNETELRAWLVRKKDANNKLANYLEDQAKFLLSGNTLDKWLEKTSGLQTPTGAIAPRRSPSTFTTSTGITFEIFE